jgi:hypothetical protein
MVRDAIVNKRYVHWAWVVLGSSFITLFVTYGIRIAKGLKGFFFL